MAKQHKVKQGECISSIADNHGFFWETLWNYAENAKLKQKRKDSNILFPGDEVFIPDRQENSESGATEQRHRFVRKGVPSKLCLRIMKNGTARANESYIINIDGNVTKGTLDPDGRIEISIPGNARKGMLKVGSDEQTFEFDLGGIDPLEEMTGVQTRLNNLGFDVGEPDGILNPATRMAIQHFQKKHGLPETGEANKATLSELRKVHGN